MSHISGVIYFEGQPTTPQAAGKIKNEFDFCGLSAESRDSVKRSGTTIFNKGVFTHRMVHTTPESLQESLPFEDEYYILTADARIDNREALNAHFRLPAFAPDSLYIVKAYEKWGIACCRYIQGDFAFALWDKRAHRLLCGRDPIGIKPFFYYHDDSCFIFASKINVISSMLKKEPLLNERWLLDVMTRGIVMSLPYTDDTLYQSIFQLSPAYILIANAGRLTKTCYWQLNKEQLGENKLSFNDCLDGLHEHLARAVRVRTRSIGCLGVELSGGLDSSLISALAAPHRTDIKAFTHAPLNGSAISSEVPYAEKVCAHLAIEHHIVNADYFNVQDAFKKYVYACDGPPTSIFPLLSLPLYEDALQNNCAVILSGFGGDEGISTSGNYYLHELRHKRKFYRLYLQLRRMDYKPRQALRYGLASFKRQIKLGMPIEYFNFPRYWIEKYGLPETIPLFNELYLGNTVNERSHSLLLGEASWNIRERPKCMSLLAEDIEYRYPLLDISLIEYLLRIPACFKHVNGIDRYLARSLAHPLLPKDIVYRKEKSHLPSPGALEQCQRYFKQLDADVTGTSTPFSVYRQGQQFYKQFVESYCHGLSDVPALLADVIRIT